MRKFIQNFLKLPSFLVETEKNSLVEWSKIMSSAHPDFKLLYCLNDSVKNDNTTKWVLENKALPIFCLPIKRGSYSGIYIELNPTGNEDEKLHNNELFLKLLRQESFVAERAFGWEQARDLLFCYLRQQQYSKEKFYVV